MIMDVATTTGRAARKSMNSLQKGNEHAMVAQTFRSPERGDGAASDVHLGRLGVCEGLVVWRAGG
jgi:hypothetical protein